MKKIIYLLMFVIMLTGCGSANSENSASSEKRETTAKTESEEIKEIESENIDESEVEEAGKIEVDDGLLTVEIEIPKNMAGDMTQEAADALAEEKGFLSVTLNDDGSITYKMTKKRHKELLSEMKNELTDFSDYIGTEGYENVTDISVNDDLTEFVVSTRSKELNTDESFLSMYLFVEGGMYSVFSGNELENIKVIYVNPDTKEIIKEVNSKDK